MRIRSRFLMAIAAAAVAGGSVMGSRTSARAALPTDEFPFTGDPAYKGIPDLDTHSGFFVDAINQANESVTSESNPAYFVVTFPPGAATENIFVFDGNNAGTWDQKSVDVNFHLPSGSLSPSAAPLDHAVTYFDVFALGEGGPSATPVWRGESEDTPPPGVPQSPNYLFKNADDAKWELFLNAAADLTPTQRAEALLDSGEHRFFVRVKFNVPVSTAVNGYKIGANGRLTMTSDPTTPGSHLWLGGFIGGLVDGQRDLNVPSKVGTSYSFSRDHYPDLLKPGIAGQHLPWGGETDPFVNTYKGQMVYHVRIEPPAGKTTEEYVLTDLVLENADFDDRDDLTQPNKTTGLPEAHPIGYPDSHGQPADQGGPYFGDTIADEFNTESFALPLPAFPPGPADADQGAPLVEVYAPGIVPDPTGSNATLVVHDLSGNVPPTGTSGFEAIPIPILSLPPALRVPGNWTLRFKNVDARNSVFLRSNADLVTGPCFKGRVFCDLNKDGDDELGTDAGIPQVTVKLTRTDVLPNVVSNVVTDANGAWESLAGLLPGTYDIEVDATQAAVLGKPPTTPVTFTRTIGEFDCVFLDFGFDCAPCECKSGRMVKKASFTTDLWVGNAAPPYDLTLEFCAGCCDNKKTCSAPLVDKLTVHLSPPFAGPIVGPSGGIELTSATVNAGVLHVTFSLSAVGASSPDGWFEGKQGISVRVQGSGNRCGDEKRACSCITCSSAQVGKGWPACAAGATCVPPFQVVTTTVASCDDVPTDCGCTLTQGYWKNHNKYARQTSLKLPWPGPCSEDTKLCGRSWLSILQIEPRGNAWLILAHQWIAASINQCRGTCVPGAVEEALASGRTLLEQSCTTGCSFGEKRALAIRLAGILDDYNNGLLGVPHCGTTTTQPEECSAPK